MRREVADAASFQGATLATAAQMADLTAYLALLTDWSGRFNLIGPSSLPDFWNRHAFDSWQLAIAAPAALRWADLGSGAGLPGVVLAIALKGRPGAEVHLVDSLSKRCRFLTEAVGALDLPAVVHHARAENLTRPVEVVTARACAPLNRLFDFARPWMMGGATGLFLKGVSAETEVAAARARWTFDAELLPSLSDPGGRLVRVQRLVPNAA